MLKVSFLVGVFVLCIACSSGTNNGTPAAECGNSNVETGELCDSSTQACTELEGKGYTSGTANCNATCDGWDESACKKEASASCGNSTVDQGETCDKNSKKCTDIDAGKYIGGDAPCKAGCDGWDVSVCTVKPECGDKVVNGSEKCDSNITACTDIEGANYSSGFAECKKDCSGWDTAVCTICGDSKKDEGEMCEAGEEVECTSLGTIYKTGKVGCNDTCSGWKIEDCKLLDNSIVPYGFINTINVVANNVLDMEKLYKKKADSEDREFDANYALAHLNDVTPNISGGYANNSKVILTQPSIFTGKTGGKYALAANKGIPPLPEKFFTLFASIAYKAFSLFEEVEMFGPQVVVMFKSATIVPGEYPIGINGENDVLIAVGEQMENAGNEINVDTLCIAAVGYGPKINVAVADNPMKAGGGGKIHYAGTNIPLYHPTQTPDGDVSEAVLSYGLKQICPKK